MKRNKLAPDIVRHYEATYHGKVLKVGHPERVAGCADCHVSHNILPLDNPESNFTPEGRTAMCGRCHSGFHPEFANYIAHPDYEDPNEYPVLHMTYIFMIILIVGVFLFFWTHTILWWRKAWSEEYARKKACQPSPYKCEGDNVERFRPLYRVMHVLLILSFLTLVMTGIPLKYPAADWARTLVRFWGGAHSAGIFHRIAATVLTLLFLYTILMSIKFLFPGGKVKGWLGRLFGSDSLFPNLKDLQDIKGMFLWFFNKGEMPKFDRWTYWEKFDFLAVFWGMFAIGLSGFMLWFPEKFSYIFPGWFINIAALVHSEEALLAALFIFTVHFFNNHIVPNKFPLEPNIFTGRNTIEQMKHERELEYERLAASGNLEKHETPGPRAPGEPGLADLRLRQHRDRNFPDPADYLGGCFVKRRVRLSFIDGFQVGVVFLSSQALLVLVRIPSCRCRIPSNLRTGLPPGPLPLLPAHARNGCHNVDPDGGEAELEHISRGRKIIYFHTQGPEPERVQGLHYALSVLQIRAHQDIQISRRPG